MKKTIIALFPLLLIVVAGFFFSKKPFNSPLEAKVSEETTGVSAPPGSSSPVMSEPSASEEKQVEVLESVLQARNDNDPRLDTDLKVLSEGSKKAFVKKYDSLAAEKRNERGTIVFLLGRNLQTEADIVFMGKVLREEPCRDLNNCRGDPQRGDSHNEIGIDVTLAYPQIVALKSLERILAQGEAQPLYRRSMDEVKAATNSPVEKVANLAKNLERKYGR